MPRIRHLNCGTMHAPLAGRLVCHVLLVEAADGLVLVDTGFGLQDVADPGPRLGPTRHLIRPVLDPDETAARQVRAQGHRPEDVRHIVVTHFDLDHIGGLADFPDAQVHVSADEAAGAVHHPSRRERLRFRARQWAHGPRLVEHAVQGDAWRGFAAAEQLTGVDDGIALVTLPGHTRGHAAVAVRDGERWVLHAGDAFYHRSAIGGDGRQPAVITAMERGVAWDNRLAVANRARLAELQARHEPGLDIVSAHDPELLARLQARGGT